MNLSKTIKVGVWLLTGLNLLMALGSIWIFVRMTPAIENIIERNELSLQACEQMLTSLALVKSDPAENNIQFEIFKAALNKTKKNITETKEPAVIATITNNFVKAFQGESEAQKETIYAILELGKINRQAMLKADINAKKLGSAGAWGIVFMGILVFFAGKVFYDNIKKHTLDPLEELYKVIYAHQHGDIVRRCCNRDYPQEISFIFNGINTILDKYQFKLH